MGTVTKLPSATSPRTVSGSPEAIDHLFRRLGSYYGSQWLDRWTGADLAKVKADWAQALADVPLPAVGFALDNLKGQFPPSLPEFRELCRAWRSPTIDAITALPDKRRIRPEVLRHIRDILGKKQVP